MFKFLKSLKKKVYYLYFDKVVNSPENMPPIEVDLEKNTLVIEIVDSHPLPVEEPVVVEDKPTEKKKPGRPKVVSEKESATKKAPVKKATKPKANPKPKA